MDPNTCFQEYLLCYRQLRAGKFYEHSCREDAEEKIREYAENLLEWIHKGGFSPQGWDSNFYLECRNVWDGNKPWEKE